MNNCGFTAFYKDLQNYVSNNMYDNAFCDLVPAIMANALHECVVILNVTGRRCIIETFGPHITCNVFSIDEYKCKCLVLLRRTNHYDACISLFDPSVRTYPTSDIFHKVAGPKIHADCIQNNVMNLHRNLHSYDGSITSSVNNLKTVSKDSASDDRSSTHVLHGSNCFSDHVNTETSCNQLHPRVTPISVDNENDTFSGIRSFRADHKRNFIFAYNNVNSFRHKFSSLYEIMSKRYIDFLVVAETKLDDSFFSPQFEIDGWKLYRQDFTCTSGGVLVYIRSDIPHTRKKNIEINVVNLESICMEVTIGKRKTLLASLYKHPKMTDADFSSHLRTLTNNIVKKYDDFAVFGDFNCSPLKSSVINDFCDTYALSNLIQEPTCNSCTK